MARTNQQSCAIGIVGAGAIVRDRHLPGLKKHPEVEIVAVSNSTYESAEKFCQENAPHATPMQNWADLLALPELDIVWIGTPPYMHSAITVSALEAGKHVFCQARMSMDLAEAEEMLATSKRFPELVTMLCPPPFGLRGDLLVKKLLAENYLGRPHHVRLQCFTGAYLNAGRARALAAADRDQRAECSRPRHLRRSPAALARRHHRRFCARQNVCMPSGRATKSSSPIC